MTSDMNDSRQLALVTGASSGIGLELALQFADNGFDVILNAEDGAVEEAAARCRERGAQAVAVRQDLRTSAGVEALYAAVAAAGRPLDAAALNAGVGRGGAFVKTSVADLLEVVELNVASTVHLARLLLGDMVARGEGKMLFTSSIASTMPGTYEAIYAASKRSEEHTSELQSRQYLVCRLLLEKKKISLDYH